MISLGELEAARVGMSKPDHWRHNEANYRCIEVNGNDDIWVDNSCDARGLVATIKAADVLIEIAKAALALQQTVTSLSAAHSAEYAAQVAYHGCGDSNQMHALKIAWSNAIKATADAIAAASSSEQALREALAKVTP